MRSRILLSHVITLVGLAATVFATEGRLVAQAPAPAVPAPAPVSDAYVIGLGDVLDVYVHDEPQLTGQLTVRSDGKVTLFMLNDMQAAGLTPEQLRAAIAKAATSIRESPAVTVRVNQSKSKFVTVMGEVSKVGEVPMPGPMTVVQAISAAGGFSEFAKKSNVLVVRRENGAILQFKFNYNDYAKGRNLDKNILLKPGDEIVVP